MSIAQCRACHKTFSSTSSFDMHRVGSYGNPIYDDNKRVTAYTKHDRRCRTEQEMLDKEMVKNSRGYWTTGAFDASIFAKKEGKAQ